MSAAPYESAPYDIEGRPVTVDRREGPYGEVALRRRGQGTGAVWEIIANGCFLMDTSDGRSERQLIRAALTALTTAAPTETAAPYADADADASGTGPGPTVSDTTAPYPATSDASTTDVAPSHPHAADAHPADTRTTAPSTVHLAASEPAPVGPVRPVDARGGACDGEAIDAGVRTAETERVAGGRDRADDAGTDAGAAAGERRASGGSSGRPTVLIGGLGVGFSLLEAVADDRWGRIVVAEREQAVIDWHLHGPLGALTASAVADPRTEILRTDLVAYLRGSAAGDSTTAGSPTDGHEPPRNTPRSPQTPNSPDVPRSPGPSGSPEGAEHPEQPEQPEQAGQAERPEQYDALCLDIDNGPDWTVTEDNGGLYSPAGLAACRARLRPGGVLAIWSAQPSPAFEEALRNAGFTSVRTEEIAVARGVPDVVHLAIRGA